MGYADELQAVSVDEALIDATSAVAAREAAPEEADEDGAEKVSLADGEAIGDLSELDGRDGMDVEDGPDGPIERIPKRPRDAAVEIAQKIRDDIRKETGCEGELPDPSLRFRACESG